MSQPLFIFQIWDLLNNLILHEESLSYFYVFRSNLYTVLMGYRSIIWVHLE